jgi:nickel/cobalt transporter (NicO) family protein
MAHLEPGHSKALIGLLIGDKPIAERAEPWPLLLSGLLIVAMALGMLWPYLRDYGQGHHHHDHHNRTDDPYHGHTHTTPEGLARTYEGRTITMGEVAWFGFTGGLLPCPSAIAV